MNKEKQFYQFVKWDNGTRHVITDIDFNNPVDAQAWFDYVIITKVLSKVDENYMFIEGKETLRRIAKNKKLHRIIEKEVNEFWKFINTNAGRTVMEGTFKITDPNKLVQYEGPGAYRYESHRASLYDKTVFFPVYLSNKHLKLIYQDDILPGITWALEIKESPEVNRQKVLN